MTKNALASMMVAAALALATPALADKRQDDALQKAQDQLGKERPDDALKTLQKVFSQPEAHLALARLQLGVGKLEDAGENLEKAAQANGAAGAVRAEVLAALANYKLRTGAASAALAAAEQAVQAEANAASLAAKAQAQARMQDPAALATAAQAVQAGANSPEAHTAHGAALLAAHKAGEAEAAYRKALAAANHAPALAGLARALREQNKNAEAVTTARKATEADAYLGEGFAELGLALLTQDPQDQKNEAIAQAQQGAFLDPKNATVKLAVGRIFESRGQLDQAVSSYREAATLDPSLARARLAAINLQYRRGDVDGALAEIQKLPPDLAQSPDVQLLQGRLLLQKKADPAKVLPLLEKAAAALAGSAEAQAIVGTAYYNAGDVEKAAEAFKRASQIEPDNEAYLANYGLFAGYAGRVEEGAAVLEKLAAKPGYKDIGGLINLGYLYRAMKPPQVDKSVSAYKRALQLDPKNGQAALGIALAYYADKRWDEAVAAFGAAKDVDKKLTGDALNGIAWSQFFKRNMAEARSYAQQAKAAGVPDTAELEQAIAKYEELLQKSREEAERAAADAARRREQAQAGAGLSAAVSQLKAGNPAVQRRAANQLCGMGKEAVPHLAYALLGADIGAKETIATCLGNMGAAAREALPILDRLVQEGPPPPNPQATKQEMELEVREIDLIRAMKDAAAKIRR